MAIVQVESTTIDIFNQEGLEFLKTIKSESVDLVLTDPPYITSRVTGMGLWAEHVEKQDKAGSVDAKTEKQWLEFVYNPERDWDLFFENSDVVDKIKRCDKMHRDYIKYGSIYGKKYAVTTDYGDWDSQFTLELMAQFVSEFYRVLRKGGSAIVFFDIWKLTNLRNMLEESKFKQLRFIEWIKTNPQPLNSSRNYLTNCREIALSAVKGGSPTFNSKYDNAIYRFPIQSGKSRFHPTQKSLPLFEALIEKHSSPGDLILDPFLGAGTTATAAKNTNRSFIGTEIDEDFFNKTLDRIKKT
jgi:site-specific DNA-methyltransferase (adenine-specific)